MLLGLTLGAGWCNENTNDSLYGISSHMIIRGVDASVAAVLELNVEGVSISRNCGAQQLSL